MVLLISSDHLNSVWDGWRAKEQYCQEQKQEKEGMRRILTGSFWDFFQMTPTEPWTLSKGVSASDRVQTAYRANSMGSQCAGAAEVSLVALQRQAWVALHNKVSNNWTEHVPSHRDSSQS